MHIKRTSRCWTTLAIVFAIAWSLLAYASHAHPAGHAQDTSCTVCAHVDRAAAPPQLPRLLPPVAQVLLPYSSDTFPFRGILPFSAYLSRAPPAAA